MSTDTNSVIDRMIAVSAPAQRGPDLRIDTATGEITAPGTMGGAPSFSERAPYDAGDNSYAADLDTIDSRIAGLESKLAEQTFTRDGKPQSVLNDEARRAAELNLKMLKANRELTLRQREEARGARAVSTADVDRFNRTLYTSWQNEQFGVSRVAAEKAFDEAKRAGKHADLVEQLHASGWRPRSGAQA
jgi:hypothetical protein